MKNLICLTAILILFSHCGVISGGGCDSYGEWKYQKTECESNFWCLFKGQQATYDYFIRQKQCNNGIVEQTKKEKKKCGC